NEKTHRKGVRALYASAVRLSTAFLLLYAASALGAYPARDLVIPIAGRTRNAAGREFLTALWVTNMESRAASVTIAFLPSGHANPSPRQVRLFLAGGA